MHQQHQQRLSSREEQTRAWSSPVPEIIPRAGIHAPRMRMEWDTRDTINNRIWSDLVDSGPKQITSQMVLENPMIGVSQVMPASARTDTRSWQKGPQYFPDPPAGQRPILPTSSLIDSSWGRDYDADGRQAAREAAGVVKETKRYYGEEVAGRINDRTFQQQWSVRPPLSRPLDVLRPQQDNYQVDYRQASN